MFAAFRALFKSKLFTGALFSLLVVSFIALGISGSNQGGGGVSNWVIKSGNRAVDAPEFKRRFDAEKKQLEQQNGPISIEQVAINGLDQQILHVMAAQESISALSQKQGIQASDAQVATELRKNTALFNQITGQFDQQAYAQRLADNGMTPTIFEGMLRDDLTNQHLASGIAAGLRAPRIATAWIGAYYLEQRTVSMFVLDPSMVAKPDQPTDAELAAFLKANAARFTKPELRMLTVVNFDPAVLPSHAKIDPAEVQKRFDFRKDSLSKPETRSLLQISATDAAQANAISARLGKGEDPIVVAKALNRPITRLADKPKTALPDPKIAAAAFALKDGESSSPIQATLGYVVIKLLKTTPGVTADLASEKPTIEAEIRNQSAQDKVEEQVQAYDAAHTAGMSMTAAAAKAGVTAVIIGPVTAQGVDGMGKPVPGATPELLKTAFAQSTGMDSEVEDSGKGVSYTVRVDKVIPPVLPPVAEIKPLLVQLLNARKTMDAIAARAEALRDRIKKGETIQAVAASAGAKVIALPALDRLRAGQDPNVSKSLPRDLIDKMFSVGPGEAFLADAGPPRTIVAHMDSILPGDVSKVAQVTEAQRPQLTAAIFRDMQAGAQTRAVKVMKTKTDLATARNAIGVDTNLAAKADGKPAPKT